MWIGGKYYSRECFIAEATKFGASRKIGFVPRGLEIHKSKVYLISDLTEEQRKTYQEEMKRRTNLSHTIATEKNRHLAEGEERARPVRTGFGPLPRGDPVVFGYFTVNAIIYVTMHILGIPISLAKLGVKPYYMDNGDFGTNDERGCGSLKDEGVYLISEDNIETIKMLYASPDVYSKEIHIFDKPIPYVGKRFRGIRETDLEVIV